MVANGRLRAKDGVHGNLRGSPGRIVADPWICLRPVGSAAARRLPIFVDIGLFCSRVGGSSTLPPATISGRSSGLVFMNHSVLYAHLLNLGSGEGTKIPMVALRTLELPMPDDVLEQFCADHATNSEFQEQYGQLDLCALSWRLREL